MPPTRRSIGAGALQPSSNNVNKIAPVTPGKQVKSLKAELDKKDAENKALLENIASLTNALNSLNIVKEKIGTDSNNAEEPKKSKKKDKDAPVPAKTAYKYFCEETSKPNEDADMRQVWKECDPVTRTKYTAMAEADKARYQKESKAYEEEKAALEMFYQKKKEGVALEFFEAHRNAQAAIETAEASKKGKKKAPKDPEAPKRPTSSYMYFANEKRESVKNNNPNASVTEITKIIADIWNHLEKGKAGENGTKKYDDLAAVDRARYESEKAEYDAMIAERKMQAEKEKAERLLQDKEEAMKLMKSVQEANAAAAKDAVMDDMTAVTEACKQKKKKDPNAPKHPSTAYLFFCNENRAAVKSKMPETTTNNELLTEIGRQWKELSDKKKAKYVKMANKDKERYAKEMETYDPMHSDDVSAITEASKQKKKKDPNAPKHPSTAYLFFCNENRAAVKSKMPETTTNNELLTEIGRQWKELPDKKKAKYVKMADKDKERYVKEMEVYNAGKQ